MRRTFRVFLIVYAVMMAIAFWDYAIRLSQEDRFSWIDILQVAAGSSVPAVMVASLVYLVGDAFWLICMPLTVWLLMTTGAYAFLQHYFWNRGIVGEDFNVSVITLNSEKILKFFAIHWDAALLLAVFVSFILCLVMWMVSVHVSKISLKRVAIGTALLMGCCFAIVRVCPWDHLSMAMFDQPVLHACEEAPVYCAMSEAGRELRMGSYRTEERDLYAVVMIGESSSRAHWSLYGYERKTTACLDALASELIVFSNLTATVGFTPYALRDTFTIRTNEGRLSLPSIVMAAGCDGRFVSAQAKRGLFSGSNELLFNACPYRYYLPKDESDIHYDNELISHVLALVPNVPTNRVSFVHMVGSHVPFDRRYPWDYAVFAPSFRDKVVEGLSVNRRQEVNHYDNSIVLTDFVLAEVIEGLRRSNRPAVLIYVSDHGESPRTCLRDLSCDETFAIPFFIWVSPACGPTTKARVAKASTQCGRTLKSTDCLPIFLEVLGLERNASVAIR